MTQAHRAYRTPRLDKLGQIVDSALYRFYRSPQWRTARRLALRRDGYRCTQCGASVRKLGTSRVDHIQPVRTHPHLALILDNLRVLCASCDNRRHSDKWRGTHDHRAKQLNVTLGCGLDGWPNRRKDA
jgi:5-methylcytosine-specific restriction endonuclease McrA